MNSKRNKSPKFAIFYMEDIPTLHMLNSAANKVGFDSHIFHLRDIRFFVDKYGVPDIRIGEVSLKDFSAIFVRGFWGFQNEVSLLGKFCAHHKITLIDSALYKNPIISKNDDILKFAQHKFPVIKTIFLENENGLPVLLKEFKMPVVAKEIRGKRGLDVYLLRNKRQVQEFLRQTTRRSRTFCTRSFQFQEFIPSDFDIRVVVLGGKVLGAIERRSADPNEFRNNISLGGIAKPYKLTAEIKGLAIKAARILEFEFCGVDFIINKETGKLYILEVNRSPGFEGFMQATGMDLPYEVMKFFLRFTRKHLK